MAQTQTPLLSIDVPCPRCEQPLPVPFRVSLTRDGDDLTLSPKLADADLTATLTEHFTAQPDCDTR